MQNKKLVTILLWAIVGGAVVLLVLLLGNKYIQTRQERQAKQIIHAFMEAEGVNIQPNTEEYAIFMRRIVWGEYPELTELNSDFIENQTELDYILDYAWKHSGYEGLYGGYDEPEANKVEPPPNK
jgi:dissimilatory sulfite reductase (desulfoviridin) alpha/beta subunit